MTRKVLIDTTSGAYLTYGPFNGENGGYDIDTLTLQLLVGIAILVLIICIMCLSLACYRMIEHRKTMGKVIYFTEENKAKTLELKKIERRK